MTIKYITRLHVSRVTDDTFMQFMPDVKREIVKELSHQIASKLFDQLAKTSRCENGYGERTEIVLDVLTPTRLDVCSWPVDVEFPEDRK